MDKLIDQSGTAHAYYVPIVCNFDTLQRIHSSGKKRILDEVLRVVIAVNKNEMQVVSMW